MEPLRLSVAAVVSLGALVAAAVPPDVDARGSMGGDDLALNLWIVGADGTGLRRITTTAAGGEFDPAWSSDGRSIAYVQVPRATPGRNFHVRLIGLSGGRSRTLVSNDGKEPEWSPSGRRLAFVRSRYDSARDEYNSALFTVGADGSNLRRLTPFSRMEKSSLSYSPDGRLVYFTAGGDAGQIFSVETSGQMRRVRLGCCAQSLDISPDGRRIAFDWYGMTYVMRSNATGRRKVGEGSDPSWSPDGKQLAVCGFPLSLDVIRPDGSGRRRVIGRGECFSPAWSPDGRRLVFASTR